MRHRSAPDPAARQPRCRRGRATLALLAAATALLAAGCGSSGHGSSTAGTRTHASPSPAVMRAGAKVFAQNCHACHSLLGRRHTKPPPPGESQAPDLDEIKPIPSEVQQRALLGGYHMPGFQTTLTEQQIAVVVAYVSSIAGRDVSLPAAGDSRIATGEQVFAAHCQRCHTIGERPRTGRQTYPGTDFHKVTPSMHAVEERVRAGLPELMPSFRRRLTSAQIEAVAAYVTATAGPTAGGR
jgi:mono/diheme cytochrome c family protein